MGNFEAVVHNSPKNQTGPSDLIYYYKNKLTQI